VTIVHKFLPTRRYGSAHVSFEKTSASVRGVRLISSMRCSVTAGTHSVSGAFRVRFAQKNRVPFVCLVRTRDPCALRQTLELGSTTCNSQQTWQRDDYTAALLLYIYFGLHVVVHGSATAIMHAQMFRLCGRFKTQSSCWAKDTPVVAPEIQQGCQLSGLVEH